jgi:hypothetical protein
LEILASRLIGGGSANPGLKEARKDFKDLYDSLKNKPTDTNNSYDGNPSGAETGKDASPSDPKADSSKSNFNFLFFFSVGRLVKDFLSKLLKAIKSHVFKLTPTTPASSLFPSPPL